MDKWILLYHIFTHSPIRIKLIALQGNIIFIVRSRGSFHILVFFDQFPKSVLPRHESATMCWHSSTCHRNTARGSQGQHFCTLALCSPLKVSRTSIGSVYHAQGGKGSHVTPNRSINLLYKNQDTFLQAISFRLWESYLHRQYWKTNYSNNNNHLLFSPLPRESLLSLAKTKMTFPHYHLIHFYTFPSSFTWEVARVS
jgi:hypothetical protein